MAKNSCGKRFCETNIAISNKQKRASTTTDIGLYPLLSTTSNDRLGWSELPATALEIIDACLSGRDKHNMHLVCRRWSEELPSIWRSFTFQPSANHASRNTFSPVQCVRKFGKNFIHLKIDCLNLILFNQEELDIFTTQFDEFVQEISKSCQLSSLVIKNRLYDNKNPENVKCILNLLESQELLKTIVFDRCFFSMAHGIKIFETIILKRCSTLKKLKFHGFINYSTSDNIDKLALEAPPTLDVLKNLTEVETDYDHLLENVITVCSEVIQSAVGPLKFGSLKTMRLNVNCYHLDEGIPYRGLEAKTWTNFKKLFPELKIEFLVECIHTQNLFDLSALKTIPIRSLNFIRHIGDIDVGSILEHFILSQNVAHLESLRYIYPMKTNNIVKDLVSSLQICQNIRVLNMRFQNLIVGLDEVFNFLLGNRPRFLKTVYVRIQDAALKEDKYMLDVLKRENVLKMRGIAVNLEFVSEFGYKPFNFGECSFTML